MMRIVSLMGNLNEMEKKKEKKSYKLNIIFGSEKIIQMTIIMGSGLTTLVTKSSSSNYGSRVD
ncbi:hypothetical protein T05_5657 [Trichinella murrelli]|uniref:Uncharacterized protein n=1 Tax=Trichinella murrelli TaxID=144512 RepID=A0A0V0TLF8_9BILA|nr:hypothetical protein T05_5657 [Trichinella murrelli]